MLNAQNNQKDPDPARQGRQENNSMYALTTKLYPGWGWGGGGTEASAGEKSF